MTDPSRSAEVVQTFFFGKNSQGIISCDRYRAYFCFVSKSDNRFKIAYCWAHVRRDFLAIAKDWPVHEAWDLQWVEEIRELYQLNEKRLSQRQKSETESQEALAKGLKAFHQKAGEQLENLHLSEPCRKVLESLNRHWTGLTTFLEHPAVPMDNNPAERSLRGGVVGRKNYYGSGSVESAELTAMMFTTIQTLLIGGINPQEWFSEFFNFIGDEWNKDITSWLPWNMSAEVRAKISLKKSPDPPQ